MKILLGCTGSVASLKVPLLVQELKKTLGSNGDQVEIAIIATNFATRFFDLNEIPDDVRVYKDEDEWTTWNQRGDPILHIDLGKWADLLLIAPLDANTMAKITHGICDNLLTCTVRAWEMSKPLVFCPAMNTKMYDHPLTAQQIATLTGWGYKCVPVVQKMLVCGDTGLGAMAEVSTIVDFVKTHFSK